MNQMFSGRTVLLATKHKKEQIIGPVLETALGIRLQVPDHFDTDVFGTFSGEVDRNGTALETVRQKCLTAALTYGANVVIASEGSFGPHPEIGFVPLNTELLYWMDVEHDFEVYVKHQSMDTNFFHQTVSSEQEFRAFLKRANFPSHQIILMDVAKKQRFKDVQDEEELFQIFLTLKQEGPVLMETDMRAMNNPTRMKVIGETALKLAEVLLHSCPRCSCPGFRRVAAQPGLPCAECGTPTAIAREYLIECPKCHYLETQKRSDVRTAEAQYCFICNP